MRIVHLMDHFQPWIGYQETYLAREHQLLGHEVIVITSNRYARWLRNVADSMNAKVGYSQEEGIPTHRLPVWFEIPTNVGYVWMRGLKHALKHARPDVVHCHDVISLTAFFAAVWKRELGYTLIYDNHRAAFNTYQPEKHSLVIMLQKFAYRIFSRTLGDQIRRSADEFVAIGEPEQEYVCALYGLERLAVPIVRLGADDRRFHFSGAARRRIREQYGWTDQTVVIGHAGTLRPSKEIHTLLNAMPLLREVGDVRLLIVGKGAPAYMEQLRKLSKTLNLEDLVIFQKFAPLNELPHFLSAIDIAVWPGDISNTAIEAMAVGLPVVACRTPYTEAIIEKHKAGILFERCDFDGLVEALRLLINDQASRLEAAVYARAAVEQDLNWKSIASQFLQLYASKHNGHTK